MASNEKALNRRSSSQNVLLKEKIVQYYECIFQQPADPSHQNKNFWDEFFLLRANVEALEQQFASLSPEQLDSVKDNVNGLFIRCINTLEESHSIASVNAVQTMCGVVRGTVSKCQGNYGFDLIDLLVGFNEAEAVMQKLIENIHKILTSDVCAVSLKNMCMRYLLTLVTVTDNISQNTLIEYLMINNIFETLLMILSDPTMRGQHGNDAVILLTLLVQYRKYEATNPYIVNLSILDNDMALNGMSQIIALSILDHNRQFTEKVNQQKPTGFISSFTSMVGSVFSSADAAKVKLKPEIGPLLCLYEAIHLNRNFVAALTTSHTSGWGSGSIPTDEESCLSPAVPGANPIPSVGSCEELDEPTNLLATFLEYTSIVMQDTKVHEMHSVSKLCFIIMTCISEDQYANSLMHDPNINFSIPLHRMPMRHRKQSLDVSTPLRPLACAALDVQVEFILAHMMKTIPAELYSLSLGIIHRLLCYQKKARVRLSYPWKQLWTALISLVKFLLSNETALLKICNIFHMLLKVVNIFNLFITYGDTFLATPSSYDELYYEIIRNETVFNNLYTMALRYSSNSQGQWKESASRLMQSLGNVRAVVNHFNPKIASWAAVNHLSSLTEEQVLEVVKSNYDTLTLKLHDTLDQYERYSEKPKESAFFTQTVRSLVSEVRQKAFITKLEQTSLLREFACLTPST